MTSISITEFETRLHWQGEREAVLTSDCTPHVPLGCSLSGSQEGQWNPEALLVAAVEGRTLAAFLEAAREEGVEVLFYQSSAVLRHARGPDGQVHFTDLIVRPHVAVGSEADAEKVRELLAALPSRCFPGAVMSVTPRIEPIVEAWNVGHPRAQAGLPAS
jgi:organic hydroperoxide reductase OsmC/OhrA